MVPKINKGLSELIMLVIDNQCRCVQRKNRLMKAVQEENVSSVLEILKEHNSGHHCKIINDDDLLDAYRSVINHGTGKEVNELKEIIGFREDLFQKILYELKERE